MERIILQVSLILALVFSIVEARRSKSYRLHNADSPEEAHHQKKWVKVWSDEFNYNGLPDPGKWTYEEGYIRGAEKQYYTVARKENAWVKNGALYITARKEPYPNKFYGASYDVRNKDSLAQYTSASITTQGKVSFTYGRFEIRAKLPHGGGVWPACWMLGGNIGKVNWPQCGELDIMEYLSRDPGHIYGTIHYADSVSLKDAAHGATTPFTTDTAGFHLYSMEWSPEEIRIFFDDKPYFTFPVKEAGVRMNPFHKPFYLILNLAIGGWAGEVEDERMPYQYIIDYVRVYKAEDASL